MNNIILEAHNISLVAKDRQAPILDRVTMKVKKDDFVVVVGHNGSGKSSLIKILSGDRKANSGKVKINGKLLNSMPLVKKSTDLICISQSIDSKLFTELTISENITLWESRFPKELRNTKEYVLSLIDNTKKFIKFLNQKVSKLSGGERQALVIALMLSHPPSILLLDEPTSALDPKASKDIMKITASAIDNHKITTIMVTHNLDDAMKYGNRLIVLKEGAISLDTYEKSKLSLSDLKNIVDVF